MPKKATKAYRHEKKALLRPEAGAGLAFEKEAEAGKYRYDDSLAPELMWDESEAAALADTELQKVLNAKSLDEAKMAAKRLKDMHSPFLNWAGKAERGAFSVPTLPLFVHERISAEAVLNTLERHKRDRTGTLDLHGEGNKSVSEKISGAYKHKNGWQNRLILGDSLQVMNSLLRYENMGGGVQMIFMDPPYGIKYSSNFQPYVRNRAVNDKEDKHLTREPEMVQAYRDTWKLKTHSWLSYMRDRLLLARDLLTSSGSCFVQINDKHVHYVRNIMDEVFGEENFVSLITFRKTHRIGADNLPGVSDYIVWYSKNGKYKFNKMFEEREWGAGTMYEYLWFPDKPYRKMTKEESNKEKPIPSGAKVFRFDKMTSHGHANSCSFEFELDGERIPESSNSWRTNRQGMKKLIEARRVVRQGETPKYVYCHSDFPVKNIYNLWNDFQGARDPIYVVQTNPKVIQRCMLMTTDPGDLVFDPTCGSGTTAYVAEKWGRRWITTDVSRIPLSLTRQRILTASYPFYKTKGSNNNPGDGFVYLRRQNKKGEEIGGLVPHVTLESLTNEETLKEEVLVDNPEVDKNFTRISSPFSVEAVMPPPISNLESQERVVEYNSKKYIARMVETLRLSPVIHLPNNATIKLNNIRPVAKSLTLHAEAEIASANEKPSSYVAIVIGPENSSIVGKTVIEAGIEARHRKYERLLVVGFVIDPMTRNIVNNLEQDVGISGLYVQANTDLVMSDILKTLRTSQVFSITGLPDAILTKIPCERNSDDQFYVVTLLGLDCFDPVDNVTKHMNGDDVPCWMLDTDYDGHCFRPGQVFFPRTGAWNNIKKSVKGDFNDSVWARLASDTSEPFPMGDNNQVAVKVIDDRGNELMGVLNATDADTKS